MLLRTKSSGFTIVELAIVIVVIAILAIVSVASFDSIQNRAHASVTASNVELYVGALEQIFQETGKYPDVPDFGSVCLGAQTSSYCSSGTMSYSGAGCPVEGVIIGGSFETSETINAELLKYLDELPDPSTITSMKSSVEVATETGVCRVIYDTDGSVTYSTGGYAEYRQSGSVSLWRSVGPGAVNTGAYRVIYVLPGDVGCHYKGAIKIYDTTFETTSCSIYGGKTVYE